ncbi:MAG: glycosyltransferase [Planctomycetes bacterium]|nr:glycosyltransferase [Planctomycetota bacterium]
MSVIVPTLNEEAHLASTLERVRTAPGVEVIVSDGGSTDRTLAVAEQLEAQIITGPPGRARQMNAGAAAATGAILIFCHADTLLPTGYERYVRRVCKDPKMIGAFGLRVDKTGLSMQLIEKLVKMRRTPYGDQALFMHRAAFEALEGFTDMPLLEDVDLIRRARRNGCPIEWLEQHVTTSGRFWRKHGVWRATMINQMVLLAYTLGVSVDKLARFRGGR